ETASGWIESPYRHFGAPTPLASARAVLFDEANDPELAATVGAELARLETELFRRQGWRSPFSGEAPLRVYVARSAADGVRAVTARSVQKGLLQEPAVLLDATGMDGRAIAREIARPVARAVLDGYGVEDAFLGPALAEYLSAPPGESGVDAAWTLAAAGTLDFRAEPAILGRLWVEEVVRATGGAAVLRDAWQRAAETGEAPGAALLRSAAGPQGPVSEEAVLLRACARLYAAIEPEASPSRLRLLDVVAGGIDAAAPAALAVRHRVILPETEETLRIAWPQDGGAGAAVVRYADPLLPPDVVIFSAGETRAVPLSGAARVDFLVAGNALGGRGIAAPAEAELVSGLPFADLEARAAAEGGAPRLIWTTASHEAMWGWAIFREQVLSDGRVVRRGPEIVPSAESATRSYRYEFVDAAAEPGTWYRYTVWAVTDEGVLARAGSTTVRTAD
ncbi:MAG: hypothetical protein ACM3NW_07960, partial [Syntrophomonadaceae bacterium]